MPPAKPTAASPARAALPVPTQIAVVLGIVVAALISYYLAFFSPLAAEIATEHSRRAGLDTDLLRARADERTYNNDLRELTNRRDHAAELLRVLPDNADMPGFMRNINTLAESSGLTIGLIQPIEEQVEQHYVRVPVRLEVTGTYLALARFFRAVSQLPRVINMENISLETPTEENNEVRLRARVLATTFRSVNPGDPPPGPRDGASRGGSGNVARPTPRPTSGGGR
jgi:type IV pilus assembly protein PilO